MRGVGSVVEEVLISGFIVISIGGCVACGGVVGTAVVSAAEVVLCNSVNLAAADMVSVTVGVDACFVDGFMVSDDLLMIPVDTDSLMGSVEPMDV